MPLPLRALRYYGGKSPAGPVPVGQWVASRLLRRQAYLEPFCGMAGILLQRPKSPVEMLNDKSKVLMNWWLTVREHPDEFQHKIDHTPGSEAVFEHCLAVLREGADSLEPYAELEESPNMAMALAWHVVITQSVMHADGGSPRWAPSYTHPTTGGRRPDCRALADRMKDVWLRCADGITVLERQAVVDDAMIYIDPPYPGSDTSHYAAGGEIDIGRMGEILREAKGAVAISGYGDTWDFLGWNREEFRRTYMAPGAGRLEQGGKVGERTEVLWMNYEPPRRLF